MGPTSRPWLKVDFQKFDHFWSNPHQMKIIITPFLFMIKAPNVGQILMIMQFEWCVKCLKVTSSQELWHNYNFAKIQNKSFQNGLYYNNFYCWFRIKYKKKQQNGCNFPQLKSQKSSFLKISSFLEKSTDVNIICFSNPL